MTIALSAHPTLDPLVGQLAAALPIKGLYYPARRHPDTTLPFFSDLPAMLQATSPRVCAFLSPYAALRDDVRICHQAGVAVLCAGPVPKADLPIASGGVHRGSPLFAKALQQRRDPSFAEPVYLRLVAGVQGAGIAVGVVGRLSPASLGQRSAGRNSLPGTSLRQPPRPRLPSGADRHGSQRRGAPASRRSPACAGRVDLAGPRRRDLGQRRAQWDRPIQR